MVLNARSSTLQGIRAAVVTVETDVSPGLPSFSIVGLGDTSVQESRDRVRSAVKNSGFSFPQKRITVNLAPADIKKTGPAFDLAIALSIVAEASDIPPETLSKYAVLGELALDGSVRPVSGIVAHAASLSKIGIHDLIVCVDDAAEAALVPGIRAFGVETLAGAVGMLSGKIPFLSPAEKRISGTDNAVRDFVDFSAVMGQDFAKRALEIAAAGRHNLLLEGSPGSGKTLLCRAYRSLLPPLSDEELLVVAEIRSISGTRGNATMSKVRPFRSVNPSSSRAGLLWGGSVARPGEISLAHFGTLFLDELREFPRSVLDSLRGPLEDGKSVVSRASWTVEYPSRFQLIAASNPCPCGYLRDHERPCECDAGAVERYRKRVSGPILDRIDLFVPVSRPTVEELSKRTPSESTASILERVEAATERQRVRYGGRKRNAEADDGEISASGFEEGAEKLLLDAVTKLRLTGRWFSRLRKVSRTIADLEGCERVKIEHVSEAIGYRQN